MIYPQEYFPRTYEAQHRLQTLGFGFYDDLGMPTPIYVETGSNNALYHTDLFVGRICVGDEFIAGESPVTREGIRLPLVYDHLFAQSLPSEFRTIARRMVSYCIEVNDYPTLHARLIALPLEDTIVRDHEDVVSKIIQLYGAERQGVSAQIFAFPLRGIA